ncbi:phage tail protein I [uncultured Tateyamaria sp.]|uniref:phage tail protein I n=1 Tax=uncultured Tateyamaria sp. TaxID=455651 RepID=UPI00262F4C54|nr:phage tail protein I [uncultured Tateyamaria sp.]
MMADVPTILPSSSTPQVRAVETVMAEPKAGLQQPLAHLWNVDTCPVDLLPWMAWAFSIDLWEHNWPEETQRQVVRNAISIHRRKGTKGAVEDALSDLGFWAEVIEWFQAGGDPHTFSVDAYADDLVDFGWPVTPEQIDALRRHIDYVKPVRSHYTVRVGERFKAWMHARGGLRDRSVDQMTQEAKPRVHVTEARMHVRAGARERAVSRMVQEAKRRTVWHPPMNAVGKLLMGLWHGQSNSVGATSGIGIEIDPYVITVNPPYPEHLWSFSGGVRPHQGGSGPTSRDTLIDPARLGAFIPATEGGPSVTARESIAMGCAEVLMGSSGYDQTAPMVVYSGGHGSTDFARLVIDRNGVVSVPWMNMQLAVAKAKAEADAMGLELEIVSFVYNGNESDYEDPKALWLANCAILRAAVDELAASVGQTTRIPLVLCQVGAPHREDNTVSPVTIGSQEFAADPANYTVAAPQYWAEVGDFPSVHYISSSHRLLGEKLGYTILDMIHGHDPQVRILYGVRDGASVTLTYSHDMTVDVARVGQADNLGLSLADDIGEIDPINLVVDGNRVAFDLTRWPVGDLAVSVACGNHTRFPAGSGLGSAHGQRSNLRAAELRHQSISQPDLGFPDWAQHQQFTIAA